MVGRYDDLARSACPSGAREEDVMTKRVHLLALAALLWGAPAGAAPMSYGGQLTIEFPGIPPLVIQGVGTVDVSGGSLQIAAGIVSQTATMTIPVTSTTAIDSIKAVGFANLAASLAVGGATTQVAGEVCTAPASGEACVAGGGLGGPMGIAGVLNVIVVPNVVTLPIDFGQFGFGLGGNTATAVYADNAVWTTRTASVNAGATTLNPTPTESHQGSTTVGGTINLVTGTYLNCCGNTFPVFATLSLAPVVPEPSTVALIVAGAGGIAVLARRRG
jgi:hypothetical protein